MDSSPVLKRRRQSKDDDTEAPTLKKKLSPSPVVIFAHGAGAPSSSDWMLRWKSMLKEVLHAADVVTFDYPYMSGGKKRAPPKAEKLVEFHSNIVKETATNYPGHPLILAGKSMGSRVGCMVASMEDINVSAVVCLGYPLMESRPQITAIHLIIGTLQRMHVYGVENRDTLTHKATGYPAKLLKKPDQCRAVYACSHLFWVDDHDNMKDGERSSEV